MKKPYSFLLVSVALFTFQAQACETRKLTFSADYAKPIPGMNQPYVWGGNATDGFDFFSPPYSPTFLDNVKTAKGRNLETFAYLEGPCGDTGGVDDGERARCAALHRAFNRKFAPSTPDTPHARWKPYTFHQLLSSGQNGVDYCEIDNLENNLIIPLIPLLREIKKLYNEGKIQCRLVLKNVGTRELASVKANVAPTPQDADFIAPFHIYEADDTSEKPALDAAMRRLKGAGAVTIISTDTNHYGSRFTNDSFLTCPRSNN